MLVVNRPFSLVLCHPTFSHSQHIRGNLQKRINLQTHKYLGCGRKSVQPRSHRESMLTPRTALLASGTVRQRFSTSCITVLFKGKVGNRVSLHLKGVQEPVPRCCNVGISDQSDCELLEFSCTNFAKNLALLCHTMSVHHSAMVALECCLRFL